MSYKVGDSIRIKTLDELVYEFDNVDMQSVYLRLYHFWDNIRDKWLPLDRIIIITGFEHDKEYILFNNHNKHWVHPEMIKCHANEYYLQEIKDELQKG